MEPWAQGLVVLAGDGGAEPSGSAGGSPGASPQRAGGGADGDDVSGISEPADLPVILRPSWRNDPLLDAFDDLMMNLGEYSHYTGTDGLFFTLKMMYCEFVGDSSDFARRDYPEYLATQWRLRTSLRSRFPQLFGGGEAYLELTGDAPDGETATVLNRGVKVMARPPGKRNSTIQLLSGGEKAMTAVALLLALFQLNPAPFCLMDEVDAPLDDANVGRFCEVVREMSQGVQFIIITHNKITMELAEHLHGVTMQEPGVSRLVSVDVQQAVALAGAPEEAAEAPAV